MAAEPWIEPLFRVRSPDGRTIRSWPRQQILADPSLIMIGLASGQARPQDVEVLGVQDWWLDPAQLLLVRMTHPGQEILLALRYRIYSKQLIINRTRTPDE